MDLHSGSKLGSPFDFPHTWVFLGFSSTYFPKPTRREDLWKERKVHWAGSQPTTYHLLSACGSGAV